MISKTSTLGMSREAWEQERQKSLGGSDASSVIGMNPYKSAYMLWAEKTGRIVPEDISGIEAVRLGTDLEDYVARRFMTKMEDEGTPKKVRRENAILRNGDYPFAHANVDRMVIGERAGLECKTTSVLNLKKFANGEYPANYYCQCMHYLAVTGYDKWYLAVLILGKDFKVFEIERNEAEISFLMDAEREFWSHVTNNTPPALDGLNSTGEALQTIYADSNGTSVDLAAVSHYLELYDLYDKREQEARQMKDEAANNIKQFMGEAERGSYGSASVSWKNQERSTFDVKRFQAVNPGIDLTPFYKTSRSRVFRVSGAK